MSAALHAQPGWCLRFLGGPVRNRSIALKAGVNVLGSGSDCDVMLPGGDVLPRHLVFTVGEVAVAMQKVGTALARLNGEEVQQQRRSVVAGDIISLGRIDFQLDRSYPASEQDDSMFAAQPDEAVPGGEPHVQAAAARFAWHKAAAGVLLALGLLAGVAVLAGRGGDDPSTPVNLAEVEQVLAAFPEVQAVAAPGGRFHVRGYVESRQRRRDLEQAVARFGPRVGVNVYAAEDMVEQARRYIGDPGVSVAYAGQGRLLVGGVSDDEGVRQKIRALGEDLHPSVLVSDKVTYRPKPPDRRQADAQAQWADWQNVLPARLVSITDDGNGLRHIQLANGSRYYEGSVLRSGAELTRIEPDGLVIGGAPPAPAGKADR